MKGKYLLFVTYHNENFDDGFAYAVDLAKVMGDGIEVLIIHNGKAVGNLEYMMTDNKDYEEKVALIEERCGKSGVPVNVGMSEMDAVPAIKDSLRQNARIGMVLLSPSITSDGNITTKDMKKLVKTASRPVVTMTRNSGAA